MLTWVTFHVEKLLDRFLILILWRCERPRTRTDSVLRCMLLFSVRRIGFWMTARDVMAFSPFERQRELERLRRILREDEVVVTEDVVDVDTLRRQHGVLGEIGSESRRFSLPLSSTRSALVSTLRALSATYEALGADLGELELSTMTRRPSFARSESALLSAPMRT